MARYLLDTNLLRVALTPESALALWIESHPGKLALSMVRKRPRHYTRAGPKACTVPALMIAVSPPLQSVQDSLS